MKNAHVCIIKSDWLIQMNFHVFFLDDYYYIFHLLFCVKHFSARSNWQFLFLLLLLLYRPVSRSSMLYGLRFVFVQLHTFTFHSNFFYFSSFIFSKMLVKRHYDDSTFILWTVLMDFRLLSLKIQIHDKIGDIISHMLWYFSSLLFIFSLFFNSKEN